MFPISFEWRESIRQREAISKRGFNRIMKVGLQQMLLFWHRRFIKRHFRRRAHSLYADAYPRPKRRGGRPFFVTGHLERKVTARRTMAEVRGTSQQAKMKINLGRPAKYTEEFLQKQIFIEMRKRNISYKQAQRRVFSSAGYGPEIRKKFQLGITAISPDESKRMRDFLENHIIKQTKATGPRRRLRIG